MDDMDGVDVAAMCFVRMELIEEEDEDGKE